MARRKKHSGYVDAAALTLDEWLSYLEKPENERPFAFKGFQFPTERHFEEYLAKIESRSDQALQASEALFEAIKANMPSKVKIA